RRIDVAEEVAPYTEDTRRPMLASLNDLDFYIVRPANTPNGPKYFLKIVVPGVAEPQVIYGDDELSTLQRAADMGWLQFAEKYVPPQQQQQVQAAPAAGWIRPGDRYR